LILQNTRVQVCGRLAVVLDGRRCEEGLPGRQGKLLFVYLVLNRERDVARDELADVLWPDRLPAAADASLSAVISRLRRALGTELLQGRSAPRVVLPADAFVDLEAARAALHRAESATASEAWTDAWGPARVALHTAARGFFPGEDADWIQAVRAELDELRVRALECVAATGLGLRGGEVAAAERSGRALMRLAPYRESGWRYLIRALEAEGNLAEALLTYERLRRTLRDDLGTAPDPATQALHQRLLVAGRTAD
jgi:DNA-binding SARP family transcriptional activator